MAVLQIIEWPAKVLETNSKAVETFDKDLRKFVRDMHDTMDSASGVGLAANQVGIATRVITILIPFEGEDEDSTRADWHDRRFTFINPVITKKIGKIKWQEGCLSFPEIFDYVDRSAEVWVDAFDENGAPFSVHATGLFSVCLQHEIDHIDGIVFFKRMSRLKAGIIKKKMLRRGKLSVGK